MESQVFIGRSGALLSATLLHGNSMLAGANCGYSSEIFCPG